MQRSCDTVSLLPWVFYDDPPAVISKSDPNTSNSQVWIIQPGRVSFVFWQRGSCVKLSEQIDSERLQSKLFSGEPISGWGEESGSYGQVFSSLAWVRGNVGRLLTFPRQKTERFWTHGALRLAVGRWRASTVASHAKQEASCCSSGSEVIWLVHHQIVFFLPLSMGSFPDGYVK